jgi:sugar lactone lactonase YvrE
VKYTRLLFFFIFISTKKGVILKKGFLAITAALLAVLFLYPHPVQAQFKKDFLYKFQSRWSDIAINSTGSRIFIINESYSRLEEYDAAGALQAVWGSFGTTGTGLNRPQGLAIDSNDILYILDSGNNRVIRYTVALSTTPGTALGASTTWGTYGTSGAGVFNNPTGIAADTTDNTSVYIADTDNNRVQKCNGTTGSCVVWGALGTADGRFSSPKGITYDVTTTNVLVTDTGNNRIQIFNNAGVFQSKFGSYGSGHGQFVLPYRITTESSASNYIYVMDTLSRIQRFVQADISWSAEIPINSLGTSSGGSLRVHGTTLYVTSLPTTLETYTTAGMSLLLTMNNDIGHPVDLSLDTDGNIFINNNFTQPNYPVVQKFNSSFVQQAEWTGNGNFGNLTTSGPLGFGMNSGNDFFVADTENNSVQKFSSTSKTWAYTITGAPTPFVAPRDVAPEPVTGNLYVSDTGNGRIAKFDSSGAFIYAWNLPAPTAGGPTPLPGSTPAPYGITVDSTNKVYVADSGYNRILRFLADGTIDGSWGTYGSADSSTIPQMSHPQGMGIDPAGNIYVADTGNNRIQRFDQVGTLATRVLWGAYGPQDGNFINPRNVYVDNLSRVYVSELGENVNGVVRNRRIQVFGDATASAGLTITQTNGTNVSEGLTDLTTVIDNYTVKLNTQPSASVFITLAVSDPTQAYVTTPVLVFTPYNWNIPQTVTVVPIHDFVANGTHSVVISHKPSSTDVHYQNLTNVSWSDVTATITDPVDTTGITFSSNNVPWATEGARLSNAYSIVLNTKPTANVTVTLYPPSSLTLDQSVFTFTPTGDDYKTPRWVHITPVHDFIAQGTHIGTIAHVATSTDLNYASPNVAFSEASGNVAVTIQDIDSAGVTISKAAVSVTENGAVDTYTVKLNSKPTSLVEIYPTDASPSPDQLVTLSPSTLTFTDTTWSTPQTVTVTAIHDFLQNTTNPRSTKILHDATFSLDSMYGNINIASVSATVHDSDVGGLLIFKAGGGNISVAEGGATDTYSLQLTSIPTSTVTATITSVDGLATTESSVYTFTPANWNTPQTATVSAVDNSIEDGTHYGVLAHTLTSTDPNFNGKVIYATATIADNDTAGITITLPNGAINIAEAGPSDTYYVKLSSQPTSPVTLVFGAQNQATASPSNLVFTSSNWSDNQTVSITAIQDFIIEGPMTATVSYTGVSTDPKYNGKTASFVANVADDDSLSPGIAVNETNGGTSVTQDITTDTYTLALTSKPSANVKIKIVSSGPEATTSAGVFWFTPNVWNVPQTVTVLAKANPSGGKSVTFTHLVSSLDLHYNGITAPSVVVSVNENRSTSSSGPVKAPVCSQTPPYSAPNLFQITTTQSQATLYFTPIRDNISYYFVAFGFKPGDMRFGTSFEMGPYDGVIDYTVNMLTAGTTYYFTVRGGNGCATGPWSAAVPATAVGPESSATATRTFYAPVSAPSTSGSSGLSGSSSPTGGIWLTRDLYPGSQGADVRSLQEYLNAHGFTLASSGAGSPGHETTYYGNLTAAAVRRFQEAHFAEILSPLGYASGTGICGSSTRNYINSHP